MGACGKGVSQCILLTTNTLIFLIAVASLGASVFVFRDALASATTKLSVLRTLDFPADDLAKLHDFVGSARSVLMVVAIAAIVLMIFSCLGCKTALNPPERRCSRWLYLSILLVLFIAECGAGCVMFNLIHALGVAKEHQLDGHSAMNSASEDALVVLHNKLSDLYASEKCTGGEQSRERLPFHFTKVECKTASSSQVFHFLFLDSVISTEEERKRYEQCTANPSFEVITESHELSTTTFNQAFCGSEAHIVSIADYYANILAWFPVCLAALTFILLVATICMMAQKTQHDQKGRTVRGAQEPLHGGIELR